MLESRRYACHSTSEKNGINWVSWICESELLSKSGARTAVNSRPFNYFIYFFRRQNWLTYDFPESYLSNAKNFYTDARESLHRNAEATTYASFPRDQSHVNTRQKKRDAFPQKFISLLNSRCLKRDAISLIRRTVNLTDSLRFINFYVVANARRFHHNILNSISLFASYCSFQVINLLASQKGLSIAAYFLL